MNCKHLCPLVMVVFACLALPTAASAQVLGGDIGAPNVQNTNEYVYGETDKPRPFFQAQNVAISFSYLNAILKAGEITTRLESEGKTVLDWSYGSPEVVDWKRVSTGIDPATGLETFHYIFKYKRRVTVWYLDTFDF